MRWWQEILDDLTDTAWRLLVTLVVLTGLFSLPVWLQGLGIID